MSASVTRAASSAITTPLAAPSSQAPAISSQPVVTSTRPAVATSQPAVTTSQPPAVATSQSVVTSLRSTTSSRQARTSTTRTSAPSSAPYDATSERRADSQRTNKILIGIFTSFGVLLLALVAFQLFRWYKRRYKSKNVPLPPPRAPSTSQRGYRHSRAMSIYKDYPTPDFSQPPSMLMRHGSGSGLVATPSVRSNAPSMEALKPSELGRKSSDPARTPVHDESPENSIAGSTIVPTDEEPPRRLSALGSRSQSPLTVPMPRPPSQAQIHPRPESRARVPRPNSASSRHSYLGAPSRHGSMVRNLVHEPGKRWSYYASGNHGAPHTPHARERVGLVMPQPLAPELFNYALGGRHDMGLDFTQGSWGGSHANLANERGMDQTLAPPTRTRTDSWVGPSHSTTPSDRISPQDAFLPASKDRSLPHGRAARPEIPHP